jgi:dolichol-phosphate mannosyltransferase
MNKILVIIATYNEIENLAILIKMIKAYRLDTDILVVDDNSPDGTGQLAAKLASEDGSIFVIQRKLKEGLSKALQAGFLWAIEQQYDFVVNIDGDLSHNPNDIIRMLNHESNPDQ